jgi:hypothetical protein
VAQSFIFTADFVVGWYFLEDDFTAVMFTDIDTDGGFITSISRDSGSWIVDGFAPGESCRIAFDAKTQPYWYEGTYYTPQDATVISVTEKELFVETQFYLFPNLSHGIWLKPDGTDNMRIVSRPSISAAKLRFGWIKDSKTVNYKDEFGSNIFYSGTFGNLNAMGQDRCFSHYSAIFLDVTNEYIPDLDSRALREKYMRISIAGTLPWWSSLFSAAFDSGVSPAMFIGDNAPKLALDATFLKSMSEPATAKTAKYVAEASNFGFYNEGGNGDYVPNNTISNISITWSGQPSSLVKKTGETLVQFRISTDADPQTFSVQSFVERADCSPNQDTAKETMLFGQWACDAGVFTELHPGIISSCTAVFGSGYADVSATLEITAQQAALLPDDAQVMVCCSCLFVTDDLRTMSATIPVARPFVGESADVEGLASLFQFTAEPNIFTGYYTGLQSNIEDFAKMSMFAVVNSARNIQFSTLHTVWIAENGNNEIVLARNPVAITYQSGNVMRGSSPFVDVYREQDTFNVYWNTRIPWQSWMPAASGVDSGLYDAFLAGSGINRDASRYFEAGYSIRACIEATMTGNDQWGKQGVGVYRFESAALRSVGYDENNKWKTGIVLSLANGYILQRPSADEDTIVTATHTWIGIGGMDDTFQCLLRIEDSESRSGFLDEIGNSVEKSSGSSWIEDFASIVPSGSTVTCTATLKKQSILGRALKISAKIASKTSVPIGAKITEAGILKITEDSVIKVIE